MRSHQTHAHGGSAKCGLTAAGQCLLESAECRPIGYAGHIYTQYTGLHVHHRTTCSILDCIASRGTQTHWKTAMYTCCVPHMRQHTLTWSEMTDHHACNCVCSCAGPIPAVSHMMHWKSPMRSHQTQRTRRQCQVWSHHGWATPMGKR